MKPITYFYLLLLIALGLSACLSTNSATMPTQTDIPIPSPTATLIPTETSTATIAPMKTATATQIATLEPEQAKEAISTLLQDSGDCEAPCFWGILPGQTTLDDAKNVFTHLGLQLKHTNTRDNKDYYAGIYDSIDGLEITPILGVQKNTVKSLDTDINDMSPLTVQNNVVQSLDVGINDTSPVGSPRKWSAYSPETLIRRYGPPSKVDFFLGRVAPTPTHSMDMYFESVNLIVEYIGTKLLIGGSQLKMCPITNQVEYIHIWTGDNPRNPPSPAVPLEEATSLTMSEFANMMTGDPKAACFKLNDKAFP